MKKTITFNIDVDELLEIFTVASVDYGTSLILDRKKFQEKLDDPNFIELLGYEMFDALRREAEMFPDYFIENEDFAELYVDGEDSYEA